jgi:hypothetical protein
MIHNDVNGRLFNQDANIAEYCEYIYRLFSHYSDYKTLALSSFNEYKLRLNWGVAGQKVKNLLTEYIN